MSAQPARKSLSIIVPAFHEAAVIAATIDEIKRYVEARFDPFEIIVVDDGSRDATAGIVAALRESVPQLRLIRFPVNKGKGASVREGMLAASSELLLMCDADLSAPIGELETLLPWIDNGADVVIGSRALKDSRVHVHQPLYREAMGKLYGVAMRLVTGTALRDTQCGFKLFTRTAARQIFARTRINRFAFDIEVMVIAREVGLRIEEVPVQWSNAPDTKVRLLADGFAMVFDLIRIRVNELTGIYHRGLREGAPGE
ncbi:MAG: dolichyl-phosphate beta-glucosyltransferase [Candidatus Methylomirabilia bacterium]